MGARAVIEGGHTVLHLLTRSDQVGSLGPELYWDLAVRDHDHHVALFINRDDSADRVFGALVDAPDDVAYCELGLVVGRRDPRGGEGYTSLPCAFAGRTRGLPGRVSLGHGHVFVLGAGISMLGVGRSWVRFFRGGNRLARDVLLLVLNLCHARARGFRAADILLLGWEGSMRRGRIFLALDSLRFRRR